ncbi:uncharacterized protein [Prorops nasuta]|uniref:uncharacterized protein n=1 Tax=Prorops nasuta TaxID=863751 RepID=UPI0034CF1FC9
MDESVEEKEEVDLEEDWGEMEDEDNNVLTETMRMLRKKLQRQQSPSNIQSDGDNDDDDDDRLSDFSSEMEWEGIDMEQELSPENIIRFDEDADVLQLLSDSFTESTHNRGKKGSRLTKKYVRNRPVHISLEDRFASKRLAMINLEIILTLATVVKRTTWSDIPKKQDDDLWESEEVVEEMEDDTDFAALVEQLMEITDEMEGQLEEEEEEEEEEECNVGVCSLCFDTGTSGHLAGHEARDRCSMLTPEILGWVRNARTTINDPT